jgi:hypothetical protein
MPKLTNTVLPLGEYQAGQFSAPAMNLARSDAQLTIEFLRTSLPNVPTVLAKLRLEFSLDGSVWSPTPSGQTSWPWGPFPVEFTLTGGELRDFSGNIIQYTTVVLALPGVNTNNRRIRAFVDLFQTITTEVKITVE